MNDLVWYSSLAAVGLSVYWSVRKHEARSAFWAVILIGCFLGFLVKSGIVAFPWSSKLQARGGNAVEWVLVVALYMAMILGMLAHYAYVRFQRPRGRRRRFDAGAFLAPAFISPIVFLPIASVLQSAEEVQTSSSSIVLFLVAFENGFFWREFFENRLALNKESKE